MFLNWFKRFRTETSSEQVNSGTLTVKAAISIILKVYRRSSSFGQRLVAINNQSIKPTVILAWENGTENVSDKYRNQVIIARSPKILVCTRFTFALNANGEYV
jgi:hypothetical protein